MGFGNGEAGGKGALPLTLPLVFDLNVTLGLPSVTSG
jgi:hypothetical protein